MFVIISGANNLDAATNNSFVEIFIVKGFTIRTNAY